MSKTKKKETTKLTEIEELKKTDIYNEGYKQRVRVCNANVQHLASAIIDGLVTTKNDNKTQIEFKKEWTKLLHPILMYLDDIFKDIYENKDRRDHDLIKYIFHGSWNWGNPKIPLGIAAHSKIFSLVNILIRCIRSCRHCVHTGKYTGLSWPYQRELTDQFNELVDMLGEKTVERYTIKNKKGEEMERVKVHEPITEDMYTVVQKIKARKLKEKEEIENKKKETIEEKTEEKK
jgi:hypothetical protein